MSGTSKVSVGDHGEGGEAVAMVTKGENYKKALFDRYDRDNDGFIPLSEFSELLAKTNIRHEVPRPVLDKISKRADRDNNGRLDFQEFMEFYQSPELTGRARRALHQFNEFAIKMVVPRNRRADEVDAASYLEQYTCWPPPITILLVTILEVGVFIYYAAKAGFVTESGPIPFNSPLIYNPKKRYEAWRYISYMLIHAGCIHIIFNMAIQLVLGIPLEMVHKFWRVWLVYAAGVLAGSLGTAISDPKVYLAGASGGVYALITGHLATIIMNFQEMEYAIYQLIGFLLLMIVDLSVAIYSRYIADTPDKSTGYSAHLCGAIAGLLVGIVALRNLETKKWEKPLWWISLAVLLIFMFVMIIWNAAFPSYFLPSEW